MTKKELKTELRTWLYEEFAATHAAVLNIDPKYRAHDAVKDVTRRFIYKFNERLWGTNTWKKGKAGCDGKGICVVPFVHNQQHMDNAHVHIAFHSFPSKLSDDQIAKCFLDAAKHTRGVQYTKPSEERAASEVPKSQLTVYIEPAHLSEKWINYSTRKMSGVDENFLVELMHNTTA